MNKTDTLPPGHWISGRWQINALIGTGPIAEVYDARDMVAGGRSALKLFSSRLSSDACRDVLEAAVCTARILPPEHFVLPSEIGRDSALARTFVITRHIAAKSLAARVAEQGPYSPEGFWDVLEPLAAALGTAHANGIVHRDLKPTNLFIDDGGGTSFTDLGIGDVYVLVPQLAWAAVAGWSGPDALDSGAQAHPVMDGYSLGLIAFFALTGRSPLHCMNFGAIPSREVLWTEVTAPLGLASTRARELGRELPPALDDWFARALAPHPGERFTGVPEQALEYARAIGKGAVPPLSLEPVVTGPETAPPSTAVAHKPATHGEIADAEATGPLVPKRAGVTKRAGSADARATPPPALAERRPARRATRSQSFTAGAVGAIAVAAASVTVLWFSLRKDPEIAAARGTSPAASYANGTERRSTADPAFAARANERAAAAPGAAAPVPASTSVAGGPTAPAHVVFACEPAPCRTIYCNGERITDTRGAAALEPGKYTCRVAREGYAPQYTELQLSAGEARKVTFKLVPSAAGAADKPCTTKPCR